MKLGRMNNPSKDVLREITWIGEHKFDFVDLTLEPPKSVSQDLDVEAVRELLEIYHLGAIGHTAYYLPYASPYRSIARAAMEEMESCMQVFNQLNIHLMNIHPDEGCISVFGHARALDRNIKAIKHIVQDAKRYGIQIMLETSLRLFNSVQELDRVFTTIPDLGLHIDVGHANLNTNTNANLTPEYLRCFRDRLQHVHLSDNMGGMGDLHLPLGAGLIKWPKVVEWFQQAKYDGTFTFEVFSRESNYLLHSRELFVRLWNDALEEDY